MSKMENHSAQTLELQVILERIRKVKDVDFSLYRTGTLKRRIASRMKATGSEDYSAYLHYLNMHENEYDYLLDALTINVTEFFRDPMTFFKIEQHVIPEIVRKKERMHSKTIRVWSAGTSHGEEAYSIAILFLKYLKERNLAMHLRIEGTDIDAQCLEKAKRGRYEASQMQKVAPDFLRKYFDFHGHHYEIKPEIKAVTHFSRHDLVSSPALAAMDLILCRNVLIYFTRPLQESVCRKFVKTLYDDGFLILGKVESLTGCSVDGLEVMDLHERIYKKIETR